MADNNRDLSGFLKKNSRRRKEFGNGCYRVLAKKIPVLPVLKIFSWHVQSKLKFILCPNVPQIKIRRINKCRKNIRN